MDVWKGKHRDRDVAIKVLRVYSDSDLQKIIGLGVELGKFDPPLWHAPYGRIV